jgi:hypothetical protein
LAFRIAAMKRAILFSSMLEAVIFCPPLNTILRQARMRNRRLVELGKIHRRLSLFASSRAARVHSGASPGYGAR